MASDSSEREEVVRHHSLRGRVRCGSTGGDGWFRVLRLSLLAAGLRFFFLDGSRAVRGL